MVKDKDEIVLSNLSVQNIFYKSDNGTFKIAKFMDIHYETYVVKGEMDIIEGECINLVVKEVYDKKYGKGFNLVSYEKTRPNNAMQLIEYLASDVFPGLSRVIAKKISDKYGNDFFDILQSNPKRIEKELKISTGKIARWKESYTSHLVSEKYIKDLVALGYSFEIANKVYSLHVKDAKLKALEKAKSNPYFLIEYIRGFNFTKADEIYTRMGGNLADDLRLEFLIVHFLKNYHEGSTILPLGEFFIKIQKKLVHCNLTDIKNYINKLSAMKSTKKGQLIVTFVLNGERFVALSNNIHYEKYISEKLVCLSKNALCSNEEAINILKKLKKENEYQLTDKQTEAIIKSLTNGVLILTGGPGTGKTFTLNSIKRCVELFNESNPKHMATMSMLAPTGRASKRMEESTGFDAETIHRKLEPDINGIFTKNENNHIDERIVIVDEMSMVDTFLFFSLLRAVNENSIFILVGDADQLQSVGSGNVLGDLIESEAFETIHLDIIQRQEGVGNSISSNAALINNMELPEYNKTDFFYISKLNEFSLLSALDQILKNNIYHLDKDINLLQDVQIVSPTKRLVQTINSSVQSSVNPPSPDKNEVYIGKTLFREGDKVIQTTNNYSVNYTIHDVKTGKIISTGTGIMNGDIGIIESILDNGEMIVIFDGYKRANFKKNERNHLELAYAITIHKVQGSEFKAVIIAAMEFVEMLMTKNLFYTAVTRAKRFVITIGMEATFDRMCGNVDKTIRHTTLIMLSQKKVNEIKSA